MNANKNKTVKLSSWTTEKDDMKLSLLMSR